MIMKYLFCLLLLSPLFFLGGCIKKTTTYVTGTSGGTLVTYTQGDDEIAKLAKELSTALDIHLYSTEFYQNTHDTLDEVTLIKHSNYLRIILNGEIFNTNATEPIKNAVYIVEEITHILNKYPHVVIQVTGHSDSKEDKTQLQDLSDNRAISIAEILYRFETKNETFAKGCADSKPLFPISLKKLDISNARVEINLYPNKVNMVDQCQ